MNCSNCGAPLNPAVRSGNAVCEHCGTHVVPTRARPSGGDLQEDLEQVEQWWTRERERFMTVDRRGFLHPPEEQPIGLLVLMVVGGVLGLSFGFAGFASRYEWVGLAAFFLPIILITLPAALYFERAQRRHKEFKQLELEYQARRSAIVERYARQT